MLWLEGSETGPVLHLLHQTRRVSAARRNDSVGLMILDTQDGGDFCHSGGDEGCPRQILWLGT
jgi:hypothetical protein